jgi:DNA-binding transcriptional MerR regulator
MSRARLPSAFALNKGASNDHPFAGTHWTRHEAASYLGIAKATLIHWEKTGLIPFVVDEHGQRWFDPSEVRRMPRKRRSARKTFPKSSEGKLQAAVFQAFEDKVPFVEIVKRMGIPAQKVRALYIQSQYELDDVLPAKPEKVLDLERERMRVKKKEVELAISHAELERQAHERRLTKIAQEEADAARREERKKRLGTKNLKPEGSE